MVIASYRFQRFLRKLGYPGKILAEIIFNFTKVFSGCHIDPRAEIGKGLLLPHPTGIVISRHAKIGSFATIYQNVTIGSEGNKAPIIGDCVHIYAGAVISGNISIGDRVRIGANALVLRDIRRDTLMIAPLATPYAGKKR